VASPARPALPRSAALQSFSSKKITKSSPCLSAQHFRQLLLYTGGFTPKDHFLRSSFHSLPFTRCYSRGGSQRQHYHEFLKDYFKPILMFSADCCNSWKPQRLQEPGFNSLYFFLQKFNSLFLLKGLCSFSSSPSEAAEEREGGCAKTEGLSGRKGF